MSAAWVWRWVFLACMGAWALVMILSGVLIMLDWPGRFELPWEWCVLGGLVLVAAGEFLLAVTTGRVFPDAHQRLTAVVELLPWAVLIGVTVMAAVLIWRG